MPNLSLADVWPTILYFCIVPCGAVVALSLALILLVRLSKTRKVKVGPGGLELEPKEPAPKETPTPPKDSTSPSGPTITVNGGSGNQISTGDNSPNIYIERIIYEEEPTPGAVAPTPREERFIDRGPIMALVRKGLRDRKEATAIVGVGGMGGVGKTELAKHIAKEFGDVLWMDVNSRSLEQVQMELARALGGVTLSPTADADGRAAALRAAFAQNPRTVIFDDVRQGFALDKCLPPSPPCAVLVTSRLRELPGVRRQAILPLDVMEEKQALELLSAEGLKDALEAEPEPGKQLARLCGHHPLALRLAAGRWAQRPTPLSQFNRLITDRLTQLSGLDPKDPAANLRANFDLSYDALTPEDQRRFRTLAVFAETGFAPEAACAVWGDPPAHADAALTRLLTVSLLRRVSANPERFALHDLLREYALEKLREAKEDEAAYHLLAQWVKGLFEKSNYDFANLSHDAPIAKESDNLAAAIEFGNAKHDGEIIAALVDAASNWLVILDPSRAKRETWLTAALSYGVEDKTLRANVLKAIGDVQRFRDDQDAALASYEEALHLFRAVGAKLGEANVLKAIGDVQRFRDDQDAALASYEEALHLFRAVGAKLGEANVLRAIGDVQQFRDDRDAALKSYEQALTLYRAVGDKLGEANVLRAIGDVQQFRDDRDAALKSYEEALRLFRAVGDKLGEANVLASQGKMHLLNDPTRADDFLNQAIQIYQLVGSRYSIPAQIGNFGWELRRLGQPERARPYFLRASELFEQMGLMDYAERHKKAAE